jgi:hypothetical protein
MARPASYDQIGTLYFIASEAQNAVKIGFATDTYVRHKSLQSGNPDELTIVAQVPCTYGAEQRLHRLLRKRRLRLEWYPRDAFIMSLENEVQDVALDRAMEWLGDNPQPPMPPDSSLDDASQFIVGVEGRFPITADDIAEIISRVEAEVADEDA